MGSKPLRQGTIKIGGNRVIALRTEKATGAALPSGEFIPVESSFGFVTKKWGLNALAILSVAALAAVICLRRFLAFRAAAPFIPVLLAASLALLTAYSAHGFVVPIVQKFQPKAQSASVPAASDESARSTTSDGWLTKAKHIEREFTGFFLSPSSVGLRTKFSKRIFERKNCSLGSSSCHPFNGLSEVGAQAARFSGEIGFT